MDQNNFLTKYFSRIDKPNKNQKQKRLNKKETY